MMRTAILSLGLVLFLAGAARADCERDSDCKAGKVCQQNRCVAPVSCSRDSDCSGNQICDRNQCVQPKGSGFDQPPPPRKDDWGRPKDDRATGSSGGWAATGDKAGAPRGTGMSLGYTAKTFPIALVDRPLVLPPMMTEFHSAFYKDLSSDFGAQNAQHALGFLFGASFGVNERLTVGIGSSSPISGEMGVFYSFYGAPDSALCLASCHNGLSFVQALSLHAAYAAVAEANQNIVPEFTLYFGSTDPIIMSFMPGVQYAMRLQDKLQLFLHARLKFDLTNRDSDLITDQLSIEVEPRFEVMPRLTIVPRLELMIPFGNNAPDSLGLWGFPLALGLHYTPDRNIDVGGEFVLNNLIPHDPIGLFDLRIFRLYFVFRLG